MRDPTGAYSATSGTFHAAVHLAEHSGAALGTKNRNLTVVVFLAAYTLLSVAAIVLDGIAELAVVALMVGGVIGAALYSARTVRRAERSARQVSMELATRSSRWISEAAHSKRQLRDAQELQACYERRLNEAETSSQVTREREAERVNRLGREIRGSLNAIVGSLELLQGELPTPHAAEHLDTIGRCIREIAKTTAEQTEQREPERRNAPALNLSLRRGIRVLVVEDEPVNRKVIQRLLEKQGCEVETACHGQDALQQIAEHGFDVVFMDCEMPVMNGYEATGHLRSSPDPTTATVPIIALTANAQVGDRARCLAAGMDDYLAKPVRSSALVDALIRWQGGTTEAQPYAAPASHAAL